LRVLVDDKAGDRSDRAIFLRRRSHAIVGDAARRMRLAGAGGAV
jgi:hypothetical protein